MDKKIIGGNFIYMRDPFISGISSFSPPRRRKTLQAWLPRGSKMIWLQRLVGEKGLVDISYTTDGQSQLFGLGNAGCAYRFVLALDLCVCGNQKSTFLCLQ